MAISTEDRGIISSWRKTGVITEVDGQKLINVSPHGVIIVMCGDADRALEMLDFLKLKINTRRFHLRAEDGGPLRYHPSVPIPPKLRMDKQLLAGLHGSRGLKKIPTLILMAHWPCGMAAQIKLGIRDTVWYTIQLVQILSDLGWDKKRIIPMLHVDYSTRMRTYFIEAKSPGQIYQ
ncbi:MAG: hypothetical protein WCT08_00225 [Patescibacteria group bacterium]